MGEHRILEPDAVPRSDLESWALVSAGAGSLDWYAVDAAAMLRVSGGIRPDELTYFPRAYRYVENVQVNKDTGTMFADRMVFPIGLWRVKNVGVGLYIRVAEYVPFRHMAASELDWWAKSIAKVENELRARSIGLVTS